jgi:hypothetical protein
MLIKRRPNFPSGTPIGKTYRIDAHPFLTHAHAESAKETILILLPEPCFFDTVFFGYLLDRFRIRTQCQLEFDHRFPSLDNPLRISLDGQIILGWISARSLNL